MKIRKDLAVDHIRPRGGCSLCVTPNLRNDLVHILLELRPTINDWRTHSIKCIVGSPRADAIRCAIDLDVIWKQEEASVAQDTFHWVILWNVHLAESVPVEDIAKTVRVRIDENRSGTIDGNVLNQTGQKRSRVSLDGLANFNWDAL